MSNFLALHAGLVCADMACNHLAARIGHNSYSGVEVSFTLRKTRAARCLTGCHDHKRNIKSSDRPSGIISASH